MEVLITSKTKYGANHVCVGGLVLENKKYIRLLNRGGARNPSGWYQYADTPLNIGDIWDIDFKDSPYRIEPHVEDVFIKIKKKLRDVSNMKNFLINSGVKIYTGHIDDLFEGKLSWQKNDKGYISKNCKVLPKQSVGFWINDIDLIFLEEENRYVYNYKLLGLFSMRKTLKWVGSSQAPIEIIPAGSLIRVSLAKWLSSDKENIEDRCYLQLSGWY